MSSTVGDIGNAESGGITNEREYKLYAALKYVPIAAFAVFLILAFIAFALPIASYQSANSGISVDSPGNIYTALANLLDIDKHIHNSVITLYIAIGIGTAYAVFAAVTCFNGKFGKRDPKDGIGATFAGNVCSGCYVVYIIFAALDFIVLGRIFAMDGGNGVIHVGAATVTILIGELLMVIVSIVCEVARWHMETKNGELRDLEQNRLIKR